MIRHQRGQSGSLGIPYDEAQDSLSGPESGLVHEVGNAHR